MIKRFLVPDQNAANVLKMTAGDSGCCGDTRTACQYTATYTQSDALTRLNILDDDGTAKALTVAPATTSAADVQAALLNALLAYGCEDDNDPNFVGVVVTDLGSTLQVVITGDVTCVSLTNAGGTAAFDADCTQIYGCTYSITGYAGGSAGVAATNLYINNAVYNLGAITPGSTTAGAVSTAVQNALTSAGVTGTVSTTTTGTGGSQTYNITIAESTHTNNFILNTTALTKSGCANVFI